LVDGVGRSNAELLNLLAEGKMPFSVQDHQQDFNFIAKSLKDYKNFTAKIGNLHGEKRK